MHAQFSRSPQDFTQPLHAVEKVLLAIIAVSIPVMVWAVLFLPPQQVEWLVSEDGPLEITAAVQWFVLAAMCLWQVGYPGRYAAGLAALCVVFGLRELDFHKRLTTDSIFKSNYYRLTDAPLAEKLAGGLVAVAILLLMGWLALAALRYILREKAWRWTWCRMALAAVALLALATIFDRTPSTLEDDFGIWLGWTARHLLQIHEEWFESAAPAIFGLAILFRRRLRKLPGHPRKHAAR